MNIKRIIFFILLFGMFFSCSNNKMKSVKYARYKWDEGQWAEYIVNYPDRAYIVRYSITGKENDSLYDIESQYIENEDTIIVQVKTTYGFKNIYNMIVQKNADKPYMFTDINGKVKLSSSLDSLFNMGNAVDSFEVSVKVSSMGDTLPCFRYLSKDKEVYFSPYIPVTGLFYYSDGIKEIKLIQYGYNEAISHVKGTPVQVGTWQIYSRRIQQLFKGANK